jgi:hypothetical protein
LPEQADVLEQRSVLRGFACRWGLFEQAGHAALF